MLHLGIRGVKTSPRIGAKGKRRVHLTAKLLENAVDVGSFRRPKVFHFDSTLIAHDGEQHGGVGVWEHRCCGVVITKRVKGTGNLRPRKRDEFLS